MTQFEFLFALYSLILGLSLVELLSGLGRALELRSAQIDDPNAGSSQFKIGWLTPLLGLFVILDLMSFWAYAWIVRDELAISSQSLLAIMTFAASYFLAARLVFPTEPARFADLDTHYFRIRRIVFAILITLVLVQWGYMSTIPAIWSQVALVGPIAMTLLLIALMGAAMVVRTKWASGILLGLLIARYLFNYLT
ncbi:hypothetical protein HME9302_01134 [Alteripontixanthobacter maritimus]|uniref:Uncharacterized protein n=1 Tax=Alteripontixanthobacter maritimus TaxID=2161824 RepID=A0A369Q9K4_9SPHN|nr:hypothetical protein [Alteripontixanthobacter maritimus]RDC59937.1 hypothetical protein HME9302_01134 [Alteripontixanthobacter maritimus]